MKTQDLEHCGFCGCECDEDGTGFDDIGSTWACEQCRQQRDLCCNCDCVVMVEDTRHVRMQGWIEEGAVCPECFENWQKEQDEAKEAELDSFVALQDKINDVAAAIQSALRSKCWFKGSRTMSQYASYRGLKLRLSDHASVSGGGWCEERQERMGEADLEWVVDAESEVPSREEIRSLVAAKLVEMGND